MFNRIRNQKALHKDKKKNVFKYKKKNPKKNFFQTFYEIIFCKADFFYVFAPKNSDGTNICWDKACGFWV